jgi:class 3 adenylate cyclase
MAMLKRIDAEQASSPSTSPSIRVGIHAGQVIEDGDDLIGNMVNLAARLTADAEPGQILVTESVADLAGENYSFEDCGLRQLRGLSRPRHVLAVRR